MEPDYTSLDPEERTNRFLAFFSIAFGLVSLCAGLIPIAGMIISTAGIIVGYFGRKSENRNIALAGMVISTFGLLTSIAYMVIKSFN